VTKTFARLLLISSTLLVVGGPFAQAGSAAASSSTPVYTQKNSGQTVSATVGSKFKIRLKACGDCGDSWSFKQRFDRTVVKLVRTNKTSSATPPAVGGIDTLTWTYKVVGGGTTTVRMVERSASDHQKVIKRFTLTVRAASLPRSG
jgi:predicted secreted protein